MVDLINCLYLQKLYCDQHVLKPFCRKLLILSQLLPKIYIYPPKLFTNTKKLQFPNITTRNRIILTTSTHRSRVVNGQKHCGTKKRAERAHDLHKNNSIVERPIWIENDEPSGFCGFGFELPLKLSFQND